jgi:prefoldin subunit 5
VVVLQNGTQLLQNEVAALRSQLSVVQEQLQEAEMVAHGVRTLKAENAQVGPVTWKPPARGRFLHLLLAL